MTAELVIAIEIDEPTLRARLLDLLDAVPGIRVATSGEAGDAIVVLPPSEEQGEASAVLTPRELEVLALMAGGASNKMIARALGISVHTAKFHVGQLIDKLDATGRTDAVAHAARIGVIHL